MTAAEGAKWLDQLAETRAEAHGSGTLVAVSNPDGTHHVRLELPSLPTASSRAVVHFLLQEWTARGGGGGAGSSLLERSLRICLESGMDEAGSGVVLTFHNPGPLHLSQHQLLVLAGRFEAHLDYHSKACKASLHVRVRQHYTSFQRHLAAAEQPRLETRC